ncbi:MAG: ABC transporter substrate-binding protein [Acidobacteriota bacterium]|nr:ABC transporter substrate-binding protein [Acidobacteriota bacterium]
MDRTKIFAGLILFLLLCGCARTRHLTVGSKNFSEQLILGEIIAQHLENRLHEKIARKLDLGGTLVAHQALVNGEIDLYPEYTGTALTSILKEPPLADPAAALGKVRAGYRHWNLEWMNPLGFDNTFAMVIRNEDAEERPATTLSEAAQYAPGWRLGVGYEFVQRADGLAGLLKTYGLHVKGSVKTMDLGLLYQGLKQKQVDMVAGNATDGLLSILPVKVLGDDRHYFPPYEAAFIVRSQALAQYSGLRQALRELDGKISTDAMRKMNYQLDGKHRPIAEIAREFLRGLPKSS